MTTSYQYCFCFRHFEQSLIRQMRNKDLLKHQRSDVWKRIFGEDGLLRKAENEEDYEEEMEKLMDEYVHEDTAFALVLNRILTNLHDKLWVPNREGVIPIDFKNNTAESINHSLRNLTQFRSQAIHEFVALLYKHCQLQRELIIQGFMNTGDYKIQHEMKKFVVKDLAQYQTLSDKQKKQWEQNFYDGRSKPGIKFGRSRDGSLEMPVMEGTAKKTGQREVG